MDYKLIILLVVIILIVSFIYCNKNEQFRSFYYPYYQHHNYLSKYLSPLHNKTNKTINYNGNTCHKRCVEKYDADPAKYNEIKNCFEIYCN